MVRRLPVFCLLAFFICSFANTFSEEGSAPVYSDKHYVPQPLSPPQNLLHNVQLHDREDHILLGIHPTGKRVILEEGSIFTVVSGDDEIAQEWKVRDLIRVYPSPLSWGTYLSDLLRREGKYHKFTHVTLKNMRLHTQVKAEYSYGPDKVDRANNTKHVHTQFIQHIDIHEGTITLFSRTLQETLWQVASEDLSLLEELKKGEAVLIGVNPEYSYLPWTEEYPLVLLSRSTDSYLRVKERKI